MKKFSLITLLFSGIVCTASSQSARLTAIYDHNNSAVRLNWNMINSNVRTSYLLLRSADRVTWTEAAKDRMLRNYSDDDIYFFNDRYFSPGKNYYRLKISDANDNTIALSPIVTVNTKTTLLSQNQKVNTPSQPTAKQNTPATPQTNSYPPSNNRWIIYPNPARDLLTLTYKGQGELKGVVNVQILDVTGKTVVNFRSGSKYKTIEIPISHLQRGSYFIRVTVVNELMMSQKFIKQ